MLMRRPKEALEKMARALELDPFNALFISLHAGELENLRRYDEAIAQARNVLRLVPGHPVASGVLTIALWQKGMEHEAVVEWKAQRDLRGDRKGVEVFDRAYQEGGYRAAWKRYAEYRAPGFHKTRLGAWGIAHAYMYAGENTLALDWLERAFEVRDPNLPYAFAQCLFDPLRSDPRFQALLRRMNLPP